MNDNSGYRSHWSCRWCQADKKQRTCCCRGKECEFTTFYTYSITNMMEHLHEIHGYDLPKGYKTKIT